MKTWAVLLLCMILAGCAAAPVPQRSLPLFNDQLFSAAAVSVSADDLFALNDEMRRYLRTEMAEQALVKGSQQALVDALYSKGELRLEYDSAITRNAAQAFAARSGNCLSLVIMTAAFAKELGLPVRYQIALAEEAWGRSGDVHFFIGHVNLTLGRPQNHVPTRRSQVDLTIDFLPPIEIRGLRTQNISEETIVAMYMNNRAAELFTEGQLNDAYWWARAAIRQDPGFLASYITLGAIYRRHGNPAEAENVLAHALEREPANTRVMSNLIPVLNDLGRVAESKNLARKLEQLEPDPPFSFFNRGMAAMQNRDYNAAKDLFAKEVDRAPYFHEFHFWLAAACLGLGETERARKELTIAMEISSTRKDQAMYAAKLARINAYRVQ